MGRHLDRYSSHHTSSQQGHSPTNQRDQHRSSSRQGTGNSKPNTWKALHPSSVQAAATGESSQRNMTLVHSLYGYAIGYRREHITITCQKIAEVWNPLGAVEVSSVGRDTFRAQFLSEDMRNGVVSLSPWWLEHYLLHLTLEAMPEGRRNTRLPPIALWIQLKGISFDCYNYERIRKAAVTIGKVIDIQMQPYVAGLSIDAARVKLMFNINEKVIPTVSITNAQDDLLELQVLYEVRVLCSKCGMITHQTRYCRSSEEIPDDGNGRGAEGANQQSVEAGPYAGLKTEPLLAGVARLHSTRSLGELYNIHVNGNEQGQTQMCNNQGQTMDSTSFSTIRNNTDLIKKANNEANLQGNKGDKGKETLKLQENRGDKGKQILNSIDVPPCELMAADNPKEKNADLIPELNTLVDGSKEKIEEKN